MRIDRRTFFKGGTPAASAGVAPTVVTAPVLASAQEGVTATYIPGTYAGTPTPTLEGIQWTLDGTPIAGATGATYNVPTGDATHALRVAELVSNTAGSVTGTSNAVTVAAAATGMTKMGLGANVTGANGWLYYSNGLGPLNLVRASYAFKEAASNVVLTGSQLDSNGWPTVDFGVTLQNVPDSASTTAYVLSFTGTCTGIAFSSYGNSSTGWTLGTSTVSGGVTSIPVTAPAHAHNPCPGISVTGTSSGAQNIDIRRASDVGSTSQWTSEWKTYVGSDFQSLRVMDILETNDDFGTTSWASRSVDKTSCNDVPLLFAMANETNKELWFNFPIECADDYVTQWATLANSTLTAPCCWCEYGNEYFNISTHVQVAVLDLVAAELKGAYCNSGSLRYVSAASTTGPGGVLTLTVNYTPDVSVGNSLTLCNFPQNTNNFATVTVSAVGTNTISVTGSTLAAGSIPINSSSGFLCQNVTSTLGTVNGGSNIYSYGTVWMARRIYQISNLIAAVVGAGNVGVGKKFRPVYMGQGVSDDCGAELSYISSLASKADLGGILGGAGGAPYWSAKGNINGAAGQDLSNDTSPHVVSDYVTAFTYNLANCSAYYLMERRSLFCALFNIQQVCYESGADVSGECDILWNGGNSSNSQYYSVGSTCTNLSTGLVYTCTTAGTSANTGSGPTGTGTGIVDGTAVWSYTRVGNDVNKNLAKQDPGYVTAMKAFLADVESIGVYRMNYYTSEIEPQGSNGLYTWGFTDSYTDVTNSWQGFKDFNAAAVATPRNLVTASGTSVVNCLNFVDNYPTNSYRTQQTSFASNATAYPGMYKPYQNELPIQIRCDAACTKSMVINVAGTIGGDHFYVEVNGVNVSGTLTFPVTANITTFANMAAVSVPLRAGNNSLRLIATVNNGGPSNDQSIKQLTFS